MNAILEFIFAVTAVGAGLFCLVGLGYLILLAKSFCK